MWQKLSGQNENPPKEIEWAVGNTDWYRQITNADVEFFKKQYLGKWEENERNSRPSKRAQDPERDSQASRSNLAREAKGLDRLNSDGKRRLRGKWTIEQAQDIEAQYGLDLEQELADALSAEITAERFK